MSGPIWTRWVLTAACVLLAGYRLVRSTGSRAPGELRGGRVAAHTAMDLGMAAMFSPVHPPVPATTCVLMSGVFAAGTLMVSGRRGIAGRTSEPGSAAGARDRAHLAMSSMSMVFAVAGGSAGPSPAHRHVATTGAPSILAWLVASYFVGYAVLSATRGFRTRPAGPALLTGCDVATSAAMAYMLVA